MTLNSTPTDEFCECGHSKDEHNETGCIYGWEQLSEDDIIEGCLCDTFVPETPSPTPYIGGDLFDTPVLGTPEYETMVQDDSTKDMIQFGLNVVVITPKNEIPNTKRLCRCGHSESDHHPVFGCVHIISSAGELNEIKACECTHFEPAPVRPDVSTHFGG